MALEQRTKISHYVIQSRLGAGGMGQVFKAVDTRLDRPVALKVLAAHLVEDPDKLRRFVQEARAASALNHPNIVTIYEIGKASPMALAADREAEPVASSGDGAAARPGSAVDHEGQPEPGASHGESTSPSTIDFIAMEFVDGTTLGEKIHIEKSEVRKLLEYLAQVADGLAKAHASGIVHRDLKPDNIMISRDEYAKILDFGLAKLVEQKPGPDTDVTQAATAVMGGTRPGVIMGTAGYMSPEQVLGKTVDQRSDIFALGCILYEAATGRQAFEGETMIDSLHKIVHGQAPRVADSNPDAPAELQRIIRKCLAKNPDERYQSARELGIDLRDLVRQYDSGSVPAGDLRSQPIFESPPNKGATPQQPPAIGSGAATNSAAPDEDPTAASTRKAGTLIAIILAAATVGAVAVQIFLGRRGSTGAGAGSFQTSRITKLTSTGKTLLAAISPDGKYAAFTAAEAGQESLWVRQVATSSNIQIIPPQDAAYRGVTFSLDGAFVYYAVLQKGNSIAGLFRIPVLGGQPKQITQDLISAVTFAPDGSRFAFVRNMNAQQESALLVANSDGSGERKLAALKMPDVIAAPAWSPDGTTIACVERKFDKGFHCVLVGCRVADGAQHLIPQRWGSITGIAWLGDARGLVISGTHEAPVVSKTQIWQVSYPDGQESRITNDLNSYAGISLSADSSALVTVQTDTISNLWVVPTSDAAHAVQISSGSSLYTQPAWTPGGRIVCSCDAGGASDIWIMDADGKNQRQLTVEAGVNVFPQVTQDGQHVIFTSNRSGDPGLLNIWAMDIDGSNQRQVTSGEGEMFPYPAADSNWVFYTPVSEVARKPALWKVRLDGSDPVLVSDAFTVCPVASPDGKFVAFAYLQGSGTIPLAVMPASGGTPVAQFDVGLTIARLTGPSYRWSPDSKGLLYQQDQAGVTNIWYQPLPSGAPRQVTDFKSDQIFYFDRSSDGKQLVCARGTTTTDAVLVKNQKPGSLE